MTSLFKANDERTLLIATVPDPETAIRNVVSELLAEKRESDADVKVSRTATAKRLGKTPMTLTRWEQAGKIHSIKIGGSIYYLEREVKAIEEGRK